MSKSKPVFVITVASSVDLPTSLDVIWTQATPLIQTIAEEVDDLDITLKVFQGAMRQAFHSWQRTQIKKVRGTNGENNPSSLP